MYDVAIAWEWIEFAVRWLHVITAIAWIGSSFYFIALDLGLRKNSELPNGVSGEEWQVHGGGFYHIQKYMIAPPHLPEHLTWFKWESYATWLSGFALLAILYYASADLYLIDPSVLDLSPLVAIILSILSLGVGWLVYDFLCKSRIGENSTLLMVLLFFILVLISWGYTQIFSGRAAFLHIGAFTATIMSANVFLTIIPNQKIVVADLKAGRVPDQKFGKIAKQRSTHNNYLTLPVLFLMLSSHYPLAFATAFNWLIASLVFLIGVVIRHYFNSIHSRKGKPTWTWLVAAILLVIIIWISSLTSYGGQNSDETATSNLGNLSEVEVEIISSKTFKEVRDIVHGRCVMCHGNSPYWEGIHWPPTNIVLETDQQILRNARNIYIQSGHTNAMPPGNVSLMIPAERMLIVSWYQSINERVF